MSKRQTCDEDDVVLMPLPSTASAPAPSPPPPQPSTGSTSRHPVVEEAASTAPRRRSALDNIGYVPENIPTPRTTRPYSTATSTRKRTRGLKVFATATTSPVRPARLPIQPAPSPSKHSTSSSKRSPIEDDDDYIVDSSDDERPLRFNLPAEDVPRSSKVPRTSANTTSVHPDTNPTPAQGAPTPPSSRLGSGTTPGRPQALAVRVGIAPVRLDTTPRSKSKETPINNAPIPLSLSRQKSRPIFRPTLPVSEVSPFITSPLRPRAVATKEKTAQGPTRIAELTVGNLAPSTVAKRAFSSTVAKRVSSLAASHRPQSPTSAGTGTKRAPGSKSTSPGAPGPKRPRVATPSPPAAEDVIIVSSSDDEVEAEERVELRRPSPSPSLGDYRPTPSLPARSRAGSGSASSDVIVVDSPSDEKASGGSPMRESHDEASVRDPPREPIPEPVPPKEAPRRPPTSQHPPRPAAPSTPSPSRHSSSSEQPKAAKQKTVIRVESSDSLQVQPVRGRRIVRGRRQRMSRKETQDPEPESESEPRPEETLPAQTEVTKPSPFRRKGSTDTSAVRREDSLLRTTASPTPWNGPPLFRPATTTASGLTPGRESPRGTSGRSASGPSRSRGTGPSEPQEVEPSKPRASEASKSPKRGEHADDYDPLHALYDSPRRPIFGTPQYLVVGPSRPPRAPPSETPGPSTIFSYSHFSAISSIPPPTLGSSMTPAVRRTRMRMDCVLLPRASKAIRAALERSARRSKKDKGKAKDPSEYPSEYRPEYATPEPESSSSSDAEPSSPSTSSGEPQPQPRPQPIKYLLIDPQLALRSSYSSLPPEIEESPDKYCHCCRTRAAVNKLKMQCKSMTYRRKKGVPNNEPRECGLYWCQRCIAKHDIPFNPTIQNFKCPLCSSACECDVCRRDRGQEPWGRGAIKVVYAKSKKRTLEAIVRERSGSGSNPSNPHTVPSNPTTGPLDPIPESNPPGPSQTIGSSSTGPEPESPKASAPALAPAPAPPSVPAPVPRRASAFGHTTPAERGPTTWHGRHTPPPLRRRRASGGHALSTSAHIFIPRGPREEVHAPEPVNELPEYPQSETVLEREAEHVEEESVEEGELVEEEPAWEDKLRAFEGDYSATGGASFLDADSAAFDIEIEHGPGGLSAEGAEVADGADRMGPEVAINTGDTGDLGAVEDTGHLTSEVEGEHPAEPIPIDGGPHEFTEPSGGTLAYPPSESSQDSHPDMPVEIPTAPVESPAHPITGTLDDHPPAAAFGMHAVSVSDTVPTGVSHDPFTTIFNESVQGFDESESEHDYGPPVPTRHSSKIDELQSSEEEPRPPTPNPDEIRAAVSLGDAADDCEPTSDLGQLHPEGAFETVPRISMGGGGGGLTKYGSLQDISLFNAVMECSDETCNIALSSSQTEHTLDICGSLMDQSSYPFELERLAIPELEDSESEPEYEPDLVPTTDPESSKSTILETPSPRLESDPDSNSAGLQNLFDHSSNRATHFELPTEAKRAHMRKILQSQFIQQVEPETRTTRSQTRKSMMERTKFLRSRRCYGLSP